MVNNDGLEGIAGDRKFIDYYYLHEKFKKECEKTTKENGETKSTEQIINEKKKSCISFLMAVTECITQIDNLRPSEIQQSYLNWIRWNKRIVLIQLRTFKFDPNLKDHVDHIDTLINKIEALMKEHFVLDDAEKAVSNQYDHAFSRIQRQKCGKIDIRVLQHCAKLLINYIDYLKTRYYVKILDRPNYSIEQLQNEANLLTTSLRRMNDTVLASNLNDVLQHFLTFCKLDEVHCLGQDGLIEIAVELAHKRATESYLQNAKRQLTEVIHQIKMAVNRKIKEILETTSVLTHPLKNPLDTIKNLGYAISHPIETSKELLKRARENPWKCAAIAVGSIVVGLGIGLGITGIVIALDAAIVAVTLSPGILGGIAIVSSAATATALMNTAVTGGRLLMTEKKAKEQIEKEEIKYLALQSKMLDESTEEGRRIARRVKLNKILREQLEQTEEAFNKMEKAEEELKESQRQVINDMTPQQLSEAEKQFDQHLKGVEDELKTTLNNLLTEHQKALEIERNLIMVKDGKAASAFLLHNIKRNHSDISFMNVAKSIINKDIELLENDINHYNNELEDLILHAYQTLADPTAVPISYNDLVIKINEKIQERKAFLDANPCKYPTAIQSLNVLVLQAHDAKSNLTKRFDLWTAFVNERDSVKVQIDQARSALNETIKVPRPLNIAEKEVENLKNAMNELSSLKPVLLKLKEISEQLAPSKIPNADVEVIEKQWEEINKDFENHLTNFQNELIEERTIKDDVNKLIDQINHMNNDVTVEKECITNFQEGTLQLLHSEKQRLIKLDKCAREHRRIVSRDNEPKIDDVNVLIFSPGKTIQQRIKDFENFPKNKSSD
uniref:Nuclear anchorage protein 1 spectrin-like repeat domain-containing protein n=1 Tax=Panagrolaimus davidi TaxID=227884 RepID=A0A914Q4I6_9BILA